MGFQTGVLVVQNNVPFEWIATATASVQFFQSMGGAIFIAVAQSVFQNGLTTAVQRDAPQLPAEIFIHSGASQVRNVLVTLHAEEYTEVVLSAYLEGLRNAYYITVACSAAAFVVAACLSWKKIEKRGAAKPDPEKGGGGGVSDAEALAPADTAVLPPAGSEKAVVAKETSA